MPAELAAVRQRFDDTLADVRTRQLRRIEQFERAVLARQHTAPPVITEAQVDDLAEDRRYQEDAW